MGFSAGDAFVSGLSVITAIGVVLRIRVAFKKQTMNIFTHLMLLLVLFALAGKPRPLILQCAPCSS